MEEKRINLTRKMPDGKTYFYNKIKIVKQTNEYIEFIDTKTNRQIRLPSEDYQLEIINGGNKT